MRLYLVRHAEAAPGTPDELRTNPRVDATIAQIYGAAALDAVKAGRAPGAA